MTGIERVKATFKRKQLDRIAYYPIVSGLAAKVIGVSTGDYYRNLTKLAKAHIALYDRLQHDVVVLMGDLFMEVEALGAKVDFPDDDLPRLRDYLLEEKQKLATLSVPDPLKSGRMPDYIEACNYVSNEIKDSPVGGVICGPWTVATNLRGAQNLLMDTVTDPQFVHELMKFAVEVVKPFGEGVARAGAGLSLSEAPASISLISPKIYREFVLPYQKEVISHLREKRISVTLHICGYIDPIMEDVATTGAIAFSIDKPSSLEKMLSLCGERCVTIGNVSTGVFIDGSPQEIEEEVRRCLDVGMKKGGFILSTGCEISPKGELEKVELFCKVAAKLGAFEEN